MAKKTDKKTASKATDTAPEATEPKAPEETPADDKLETAKPADKAPVLPMKQVEARCLVTETVRYGALRVRLEKDKKVKVHEELYKFLRGSERVV